MEKATEQVAPLVKAPAKSVIETALLEHIYRQSTSVGGPLASRLVEQGRQTISVGDQNAWPGSAISNEKKSTPGAAIQFSESNQPE